MAQLYLMLTSILSNYYIKFKHSCSLILKEIRDSFCLKQFDPVDKSYKLYNIKIKLI